MDDRRISFRFVIALALLIVCLAATAWADFKAGEKAYHLGDYATALREWQPLAKQGQAPAQYQLGVLYSNGQGVPKDDAQARQWYEKAAAQGNRRAQNNLGYLYVDGKGVQKDEKMGVEWIQKSAEQGHANEQDSLGEMYRDGRGVQQDNVRAYMWYNLASEQSLRQGGKSMKYAQRRDAIAQQLTPTQIAEAQRLSQQCQVR